VVIRLASPQLGQMRGFGSSSSMTFRVPHVDADGNEIGGVPNVLTDAPLGTYFGWNPIASVHQGKACYPRGGIVPFARTRAERLATGDASSRSRSGTTRTPATSPRPPPSPPML